MKYKILLFVFPFITALILLLLFVINNKSLEFVSFFFFSSAFISEAVKETIILRKVKRNRELKNKKLIDVINLYIYSFSLFIIGIIHVAGNLDYPRFLILDGWDNLYILSTRIMWFLTVFFCDLLTNTYALRKQKVKSLLEKYKLKSEFFQALLFPTISIPSLIAITDFLNIYFPRNIVVKVLLQDESSEILQAHVKYGCGNRQMCSLES